MEVRPQFTYSPEGVLEITAEYDRDKLRPDLAVPIERLSERAGVDFSESQPGEPTKITMNVEEALGSSFNNQGNGDIAEVLQAIDLVLPVYPDDEVDRVVGLEWLGMYGARGVIYPHFQRWLDNGGIDEEVGENSIKAMALPMEDIFEHIEGEILDGFHYHEGRGVTTNIFQVLSRDGEFSLYRTEQTDEALVERLGSINWATPDLTTLGSCACWGSDAGSRRITSNQGTRLYEISPHNVDTARQSLSLVMGLGMLAYEAAKYKGSEDVFAKAKWREVVHPKPPIEE